MRAGPIGALILLAVAVALSTASFMLVAFAKTSERRGWVSPTAAWPETFGVLGWLTYAILFWRTVALIRVVSPLIIFAALAIAGALLGFVLLRLLKKNAMVMAIAFAAPTALFLILSHRIGPPPP